MTFQTQRLKTTAPTITTMLMIRPTGLRHFFGFTSFVAGAGAELGVGFCVEAVEGVVELSIANSVFETNQPHSHRPHDCHANVNKSFEPQMHVELEANQDLPGNNGKNKAENNAHHPCGKIGPENINRWRMSIHFR